MEFLRSGKTYQANIGFRLEYERIPEGNEVVVDLDVYPVRPSDNYKFEIDVPQSTNVSEVNNGYRLVYDFDQLNEGWVEIRNPASPNPEASKKLAIPKPRIFIICEAILEERGFYGHEDWIKENLSDEREGYYLLNFRAKSEKILRFKDHVKVLSFLADQHPRVSNVIASNSPYYFINRVLNSSEPHSITSFSDFKFKVDAFNRQDFLPFVNYNDVLREALQDIYKRQRNSGFSYVEHLIDRIHPTSESNLKYLSRDVCALYLACFVRGGKLDLANEIFTGWRENARNRDGEYQEEIGHIENQLLPEEISERNFAEYLYYVGRQQVVENKARGTLPLFDASSDSLDDSEQLSQFAEFWTRMREGQRELHNRDGKARESFDEALTILESIDDGGEKVKRWQKEALSGKYRAIVNDYESDSGAESAIQYLTHFVEDDLSDLDSDSDLLTQVQALRYDLISKENIRNSAVDLAEENIHKAIKHYSEAGLSKSQARIYARGQKLKAFLDEINLEFAEAAEKYETVSDIYSQALDESASATKYQDITYICLCKSQLLNREPGQAIDFLKSVSGFNDTISKQVVELTSIANHLRNYNDENVSDEIKSSENITVNRVDGLLRGEFNLDETKFVIYAGQHLRRYGFSVEVLDSMIDIALKDSFAPTPKEANLKYNQAVDEKERNLLLNISLDEVWQSKLPAHIHYQIEKLKIHEITVAGDHSTLIKELTTTLEVLLVIVGEYYSKKKYGEIDEEISPINNAALGSLMTFIESLPSEELAIVNELKKDFSEDILPNREITEIRNAGAHGSVLRTSESEYEKTREKLIGIFKKISPYCPVIIEVEDKAQFGMSLCILHWGGLKNRIWLNTAAQLEKGRLYYLPPGEIDSNHLAEVDEDSIILCEAERAQEVTSVIGDLDPEI